jgi:hypothetical protein
LILLPLIDLKFLNHLPHAGQELQIGGTRLSIRSPLSSASEAARQWRKRTIDKNSHEAGYPDAVIKRNRQSEHACRLTGQSEYISLLPKGTYPRTAP